ncbi:MAG: hypothetical protein KDD89_04085, partial [Anaerolineales bacterium]|nr:hypothetical protein [Anaerolineales bacterium]
MKSVSFVRRGALLGLLSLLSLATAVGLLQANTADTFSLYLPITMVAPPPPPPPVPPEHVATFPLLGAGCPANIAHNEATDWFYVTNEGIGYYSVSLLRQRQFDRNIFTGNWPVHVTSDPDSSRVYVSNVLGTNGKGTISLFNADQVIAETLAHHG